MLSPDQFAVIAQQEGVRYFVYDDATGLPIKAGSTVKGNPTIGYGRCLSTEGITPAEASALLGADWSKFTAELQGLGWFTALDPVRQFVVTDMTFQMGYAGMLKFSAMIDCIEKGDYADAASAMLASEWAKETPTRAAQLADAMKTGKLSAPIPAPVKNLATPNLATVASGGNTPKHGKPKV